MTFSICVREEYTGGEGRAQTRFGVAVTTRLPAVGALCPFASESGAVATQSVVNVELGRRGIDYLDDGLRVDDALEALLNVDEGRSGRQLHGVGAESEFAFSGAECREWFGHRVGGNYTLAGNHLTGESVLDAAADAYESGDRSAALAKRLVDVLDAGHRAGGDRREGLEVQSAALVVTTTEERTPRPYYDDLRVDATRTPIADLRETYETARAGYEAAVEKYLSGERDGGE